MLFSRKGTQKEFRNKNVREATPEGRTGARTAAAAVVAAASRKELTASDALHARAREVAHSISVPAVDRKVVRIPAPAFGRVLFPIGERERERDRGTKTEIDVE